MSRGSPNAPCTEQQPTAGPRLSQYRVDLALADASREWAQILLPPDESPETDCKRGASGQSFTIAGCRSPAASTCRFNYIRRWLSRQSYVSCPLIEPTEYTNDRVLGTWLPLRSSARVVGTSGLGDVARPRSLS